MDSIFCQIILPQYYDESDGSSDSDSDSSDSDSGDSTGQSTDGGDGDDNEGTDCKIKKTLLDYKKIFYHKLKFSTQKRKGKISRK